MVTIIIPAYNEEDNIKAVIKKIPKNHEIIVVDDGSTDDTAKIVKSMGHCIVRIQKNSGKGGACLKGIKESKARYCVFIDGDGQLDPVEIKKFLNRIKNADIVIGERSMDQIPFARRVSNTFARACVNYITGLEFNDVLCGFRAVKKDSFMKLNFKKLGYYFESEMLIEASKKNLKIEKVNVMVEYKKRKGMPVSESIKVAGWLLKNVIKKSIGVYDV
jgi:glycosyltransferase involved in cell wall biosynthesis